MIERAEHRRTTSGEPTIFFLDEIHRFNKAQQDTLLPAVEEGLVTLVGATTENPYFEVNSALLSRCRVYELHALGDEHVLALLRRALGDERGIADAAAGGGRGARVPGRARGRRRAHGAGGARAGLRDGGRRRQRSRCAHAEDALQRRAVLYDKGGDRHYDTISAWIKATRGSDPDASLLYLAAMLEGGEDPRFIARRMVILASEDIGNADPRALEVAVAAAHAVEHVGLPECALNLAQAARLPGAGAEVERLLQGPRPRPRVGARARRAAPAGAPARAPPTRARRSSAAARATTTPTTAAEGVSEQELMPPEAEGERFLELTEHGEERELRERLERIRRGARTRLRPRRAESASMEAACDRRPGRAHRSSSRSARSTAAGSAPCPRSLPPRCSRWWTTWPRCSRSGRSSRWPTAPATCAARGQVIIDQLDDLTALLTREQGKPRNESYVDGAAAHDRRAALDRRGRAGDPGRREGAAAASSSSRSARGSPTSRSGWWA